MSLVELPDCPPNNTGEPFSRPSFNSQNTQDRLREGERRPSMTTNIKKNRRTIFREVGLAPDNPGNISPRVVLEDPFNKLGMEEGGKRDPAGLAPLDTNLKCVERGCTAAAATAAAHYKEHSGPAEQNEDEEGDEQHTSAPRSPQHIRLASRSETTSSSSSSSSPASVKSPWYAKIATGRRPKVKVGSGSGAPPSPFFGVSTMTMLALTVAVIVPTMLGGSAKAPVVGVADAGVIIRRADNPTDTCARWAQQTALLNGTLYIYGGEAKATLDQVNKTWNNDFLTLDLTTSWEIASPSLTGMPQPSGPPAVALGYLWNDYNNLYLYGGEFADNPEATPAAVATWKYTAKSGEWTEYTDLTTSAGNFSDGGGVLVERSAEGAGVSVPELGLSWYFGGHLDYLTTPGWSINVARVYLKTLLEFTHPGYANNGVASLVEAGAPAGGAYRNITQGGVQTSDAFTERADGVLVFVPGWGVSGVLIGLAGGTADDFTNDMSQLDVYDIATSTWYHQTTTGTAPGVRVNPCAVVASAPDASSFQIYLFGGQNLQPAGDQIQYDDMYILTIPAFTWIGPIPHSGSSSSIPSARAGHTCNLRDGQIVLVGGFNTTATACDSPGVYIFNASSLAWSSSFTALSPSPNLDPGNSVLAASYGYTVPEPVVSVIGGSPAGSATLTTPAASATGGPFATGKSPVFTITASGATSTSTTITSPGAGANQSQEQRANDAGLIAAIVVAVLAGLAAGYLGYCAWLYRRQVRAYRTHLAVTNRFPARSASAGSLGGMLAGLRKTDRRTATAALLEKAAAAARESSSTGGGQESFGWVGRDPASIGGGGSGTVGTAGSSSLRPSPNYGGEDDSAEGDGSAGRPSTSGSTDGLLGEEPSYFSVVLGPRRALRVVNGLEEGEGG
ncbi:unnamed protein product [Discula destructiva]